MLFNLEFFFDLRHKLARFHFECLGDFKKGVKRGSAFTALNCAEVRPADTGKAADKLL